MSRRRPHPPPTPTELRTWDEPGKHYRATYTVEAGCITVELWGPGGDSRTLTTQLGGSAAHPEFLARLLLSEMLGAMRSPATSNAQ
jgi:hypothetical protein